MRALLIRLPKRGITVALALAAIGVFAPAAQANHAMETIVQDDAMLLHRSDEQVASTMSELASMGVDRVRLTANWSAIAPDPGSTVAPNFDASNPDAYPADGWAPLDRAVRDATADGMQVDIDIAFWAPLWATSDTDSEHARRYINVADYAQFAQAVARRYSGSFVPASPPAPTLPVVGPVLQQLLDQSGSQAQQQAPLPSVGMFTIWNEPNMGEFLEPQWVPGSGGQQPESPQIYRQLVYAAYPAVKNVDPNATVLVGGTSASTIGTGGDAVPPLQFIRALACVDQQLRPLNTPDCQNFRPIPGDGWAHHAYAFSGPPGTQSRNPNNAAIGELPRLTTLLGRLVTMGRLSPALRDVWITEFGYPTGSRMTWKVLTQSQQAQYLAWGEYLAWSTPHVRSFAQFMIQDVPGFPTGLYDSEGVPKLAAQSFPATLWAQYPKLPPGRAGAAGSPLTTAFVHIRTARGPTQVQIGGLGPGGTWAPLAGVVSWGGNPGVLTDQFTTDPDGYLLVHLRRRPASALRATFLTPSGWQQGLALPAQAVADGTTQLTLALRHG